MTPTTGETHVLRVIRVGCSQAFKDPYRSHPPNPSHRMKIEQKYKHVNVNFTGAPGKSKMLCEGSAVVFTGHDNGYHVKLGEPCDD